MRDNLTGIQPADDNRTPWSPADNSELSLSRADELVTSRADELVTNFGDTQELDSPAGVAHEYTDKLAGVVTQAKDYLGEKVSTVGGKIKEFATDDLSGMANKAKDFARQNPGQAILVSAAAGLLLGLFVRARR